MFHNLDALPETLDVQSKFSTRTIMIALGGLLLLVVIVLLLMSGG